MGAALALAQAIPPHRERLAPPKRPLTLVSSGTSAPPESSISSTTHHQAERATPKLQLVPPRESGRSIDPLVDGDVSRELLSLLSSVPQTESPFGFVEVPERCVQQQFDDETGLYYLRARYMNPALGKFIQKDPAGYGAGMNLYDYCNNDPINHSDPSGWTLLATRETELTITLTTTGQGTLNLAEVAQLLVVNYCPITDRVCVTTRLRCLTPQALQLSPHLRQETSLGLSRWLN